MRTTDLKRLASLAQWKERVAECRSSGMKVREWCEAQGICVQTYYRWERCVLHGPATIPLGSIYEHALPLLWEPPGPY